MARKRMIDPSFWTDEKIGSVEPRVRLLFMGLISQADDEGRLNGHPALIKSLIFPYDYETGLDDVEKWIAVLASKKLIVRYQVDSQHYILITNFKKHQTINRPQPSKLPEPNESNVLNDHGAFSETSVNDHAQKNLKEFKLSEVKGREVEGRQPDKIIPLQPQPLNPFQLFENEGFGTLSSVIGEKIGDFIDTYGERWVCEAMKEASYYQKRNLPYVRSILERYRTSGIDEPWNQAKEGERNDAKTGVRQGNVNGSSKSSESQPTILPSKWAKVADDGTVQVLQVPR